MSIKSKPFVLSDSEIKDWETKDMYRRKVKKFEYAIEEGSEECDVFYVVSPSKQDLTVLGEKARRKDPLEDMNDFTINQLVLAGDIDKLNWDTELYMGILDDLSKLGDAKKKK